MSLLLSAGLAVRAGKLVLCAVGNVLASALSIRPPNNIKPQISRGLRLRRRQIPHFQSHGDRGPALNNLPAPSGAPAGSTTAPYRGKQHHTVSRPHLDLVGVRRGSRTRPSFHQRSCPVPGRTPCAAPLARQLSTLEDWPPLPGQHLFGGIPALRVRLLLSAISKLPPLNQRTLTTLSQLARGPMNHVTRNSGSIILWALNY